MLSIRRLNILLVLFTSLVSITFLSIAVATKNNYVFIPIVILNIVTSILARLLIRCPKCGHYLHYHHDLYYAPWIGEKCEKCAEVIK